MPKKRVKQYLTHGSIYVDNVKVTKYDYRLIKGMNIVIDTDSKNNLSEKQLNTIEQGFMKIFTELLKTVNELLIEIDFKIKTDSSILAKYSEIEIIEDKDIDK